MLRALFAIPAFVVLASCQMTTPVEPIDQYEAKIARTMVTVDDCRRSECGRLDLDRGNLEDYSIIADMTHVTAFMTSFTDFKDLSDIAAMSQLRELHIGATLVDDLSELSNFPNLTLLHAQDLRDVTDLRPIGSLRNLQELALGLTDVGDLSFVRGLTNLKQLSLPNAGIEGFDGLRNHPTLEVLDMGDASLPDDLSILKTIPNLRQITIANWNVPDDQTAIIAELEASGVKVDYTVSIIVC